MDHGEPIPGATLPEIVKEREKPKPSGVSTEATSKKNRQQRIKN